MKVLTTAGLTKLIQLCKNAIPTVPVTDVTVGGTSVVSSGVAVVPAIPTVNDATLTIQKNGTSVATFTANASSNVTANISVPTTTNDLTNNSGFITSSDIPVTDVTVGGTSVVSSGVAVVPAIPTVNNSTITITQGGVTKGSFTLNQATGDTIALDAGGGDVEWAIYGTTTHQQISDWANAGKEVLVKSTNGVTIYRLVHADVSEHIFTTANLKAISYCYVTSQNVWYSSANNLQVQIPAGTAGNVITYTGTAGSIGSATLATVATSGDYNDLSNKPTIPTVNDSTITITQGGVTKGSFTLNQASGDTIALDAGGVTAFQAPTAQNNYTWYRKYADGWVEQGGKFDGLVNGSTSWLNKTVSLPIQMADTNYSVIASDCGIGQNTTHGTYNLPTSSTQWSYYYYNASDSRVVYWQVSGMYAQ